MKALLIASAVISCLFTPTTAQASQFTRNSPTGGTLPSGVTEIGGIVLDLKGTNGVRVVSQLAASSLYRGFANAPENGPPAGSAGGNPLVIGTQLGFTSATLAALGGGLSSASVRFTLFDGDSGPFDFDSGMDNSLGLNGINFGYWSGVSTQETSSDGLTVFSSGSGFGNNILSTGFFTNTNSADLSTFFATLTGGSVAFSLTDVDPFDNFYDFTQGIDGGLIDVGTGPVVTPVPGVPEPATWAMMLLGFGFIGAAMRRKIRVSEVNFNKVIQALSEA
ncbi:PEPxxWA-CTERM sorting domain-containing protein [Sphingomonas qilianensis]|uniref:PEPxxWA-CTERM sorting domain-containing protein n=1 Tax=Sphingomonas qilianensis TaxID=1736690 RepID=A0ABU9XNW7_9SPHN